jgi:PIN domain nuclease of toxin-antitoxin system
MSAVLDTHTVLWYLENSSELSALARKTIEDTVQDARHVRISAISLIETVYLVERRRLPLNALERLRSALTEPNSGMLIAPVDAGVADALPNIPRDVVPDMPDPHYCRNCPTAWSSANNPRPPNPIRRNPNDLVMVRAWLDWLRSAGYRSRFLAAYLWGR